MSLRKERIGADAHIRPRVDVGIDPYERKGETKDEKDLHCNGYRFSGGSSGFPAVPEKERGKRMKRMICLILALVLTLALVACGKKSDDANVDLAKVCAEAVEYVMANSDMVLFEAAEGEIKMVYPDLDAIKCKQLVGYFPPVMGASYEVVMAEVENSADVDKVKAILQSRIDTIVNDTTYPDNAAGWKAGAAIYTNGNYVVLSVLPESIEKPAAFKAEF